MEPARNVNSSMFYREVVIHPNVPHTAFSNWNQFMMEFREGSTIEVEMNRMKAVAGISIDICAFLGESLLPPELGSGVLKHSSAAISIYPKSQFYNTGLDSTAVSENEETVIIPRGENEEFVDMFGHDAEKLKLPNNANEGAETTEGHFVSEVQADITSVSMDYTAEVSSHTLDETVGSEQDPGVIATDAAAENLKNATAVQEEQEESLGMNNTVVNMGPLNDASEEEQTKEVHIRFQIGIHGHSSSVSMDNTCEISADEITGHEQSSDSIIVTDASVHEGKTATEVNEVVGPSDEITGNKAHDASDIADGYDMDPTVKTLRSVGTEERVLQLSDAGNISSDDSGAPLVSPKTEEIPAQNLKTEIGRRRRRRSLPSKADSNQQKHDPSRRSEPVMMTPRRATLRRPSSVAHEEDEKLPKLRRSTKHTPGFEGVRSPNENSKPTPSRTRGRARGTNRRRSSAKSNDSMKKDQMEEEQENTDMALSSAGIAEFTFSALDEFRLRSSSAENTGIDDSNANTTANLSPERFLGFSFTTNPTDL